MDSANKVISFVLGLVVVIVFIAVITGRIKLKPPSSLPFFRKTAITTSPTPKPNIISSITTTSKETTKTTSTTKPSYRSYNGINKVRSIPGTGAPTVLLPLAISSLLGGVFLRKRN